MTNFPLRLKEARKLYNVTQKQVAEGIQMPESSYQKYEHGKVEPSISKLMQFCRYFNVSADYLLGLSDEPVVLSKDDSLRSAN